MGQANTLRLMLNRTTVYNGMFELFNNGLMDGVALYSYTGQQTLLSSRQDWATLGALTKSSTVEAFCLRTTGAL
jgi:hypothetical protein